MVIKEKQIIDLIHGIANYIDKNFNNELSIGAFGEKSGCLLFMAYYSKYFKKNAMPLKTENYLDSLASDLCEGIYTPSYCHGVSGTLFLLNHLNKYKFINIDTEEVEYYYIQYLKKNLTILLEDGNYDFLHGALGIIYYFLSSPLIKKEKDFFKNFLNKLLKSSINKNHNEIYWEDKFNGVISNISLSHGICSIILILSYIYKLNLCSIELKNSINKAINYILSQKYAINSIACYPNINKITDFTKPRLAWCYGDLGIGITLWQVAEILDRQDLLKESVYIFKCAEKRLNLVENRVYDACFCHGSAGISYLFRWMYCNCRKKSFWDTSDYWLSKTIEFSSTNGDTTEFKSYSNGKFDTADMSLLDGITGIGMVLMSSLIGKGNLPPWDSLFLLNLQGII